MARPLASAEHVVYDTGFAYTLSVVTLFLLMGKKLRYADYLSNGVIAAGGSAGDLPQLGDLLPAAVVGLMLVLAFPQPAMWLPSLMR